MKKIFLILITIFSVMSISYATESGISAYTGAVSESPQICQFSLSKYTGTVDSRGDTGSFTVGLSCPQEKTVYATVGVVIDGSIVASKVVEIEANQTKSSTTYISVGSSYSGQKYNLLVE